MGGETLAPEMAPEIDVIDVDGEATGTVRTIPEIESIFAGLVMAWQANPKDENLRAMVDEYLIDCKATYRANRPLAAVAFDKAIATAKAAYDKAVAENAHLKDAPKVALTKGNAAVGFFSTMDGFADLAPIAGDKGSVSAEAKAAAGK